MLKSFSVKNFKNFKELIELDLSSSNKYEFNQDCVKDDIVKTALVYGYNGVGKSNLGLAIFDIIVSLTDKVTSNSFYQNYQNAYSGSEVVEFKYVFKFPQGVVEYSYGKYSYTKLIYETLIINNKTVISYNRDSQAEVYVDLEGAESLNKNISEMSISAVKYVKSNTVLPPTVINQLFVKFYTFVDNMLIFWSLKENQFLGYESGPRGFLQDMIENNRVQDFKAFLHDSGLSDNIKVENVNNKQNVVYDFGEKTIEFYSNTSTGIKAFTLFYYWYQRMQLENSAPSFVYIDEYDAFYHSAMAEFVIKKLKALDMQVVLTTHNTSLMTNELMRPDCCYLMYQDKILPLSKRIDKELRYAHNIEKMYKAGSFHE